MYRNACFREVASLSHCPGVDCGQTLTKPPADLASGSVTAHDEQGLSRPCCLFGNASHFLQDLSDV